ncbi:nitrogen permease regulator of amino acid transport activity 3-domain-containing protein [Lentinula aff. lateritia]|uniref:Nitrogen permease regulator of amino acid transport activity 3-domain-containing protein n=1 Tax=Lentinula aff. lateritia TaxID=2804960 RepID=A0ACC1TUF8_9AGAR|nr:nitrogen permease regulator of amino acid transport activity 3-domain-containing protein [Lentinula aff. lateritia]
MAETLLAILLVNSSAKGSTLVYHWPPDPVVPPRLRRALPVDLTASQSISQSHIQQEDIDPSYRWERTNSFNRDRSLSYNHPPSSGRTTPAPNDIDELEDQEVRNKDKYENVFGYASEFLASILCPSTSMCHQKFQLTVDDLAFIGHPVCVDWDGVWRFNSGRAKTTSSSRGGNSRDRGGAESGSPSPANRSLSLDKKNSGQEKSNSAGPSTKCTWLHTFNFVLVLDLPDPSSSASGNLSKYFDILYDQVGFVVAAVLFQEQVLSNFVEQECDLLGSLKDECIRKSEPYPQYFEQALDISSVASAMKTLYDAIKSSSVAYLSIHDLPLELQLPPHLDDLLHNEEDSELDTSNLDANANSSEADEFWGTELSFGWQLPVLAPWKSLLLLDEIHSEQGQEAFANLRSPYITPEDRPVVESLMRFLDTVNVTLSLADLASLLDWDLETQVFPTVRWLVLHRKAKIVDIINLNLKTVFTLPTKFDRPSPSSPVLSPHTSSSHPSRASQSDLPQHPLPLPEILSIISTSSAKQTGGNHFFGSVLESRKDLIPLYHQVVSWMLKHDLILVLHLRIRVVATPEVKALVKAQKGNANARKVQRLDRKKKRKEKTVSDGLETGASLISTPAQNQYDNDNEKAFAWLSMSPKSARKHSQNYQPPHGRGQSQDIEEEGEDDDEADDENEEETEVDAETDTGSHNVDVPSMIKDPGRATSLQRRWLNAMSLGKDQILTRRFELTNQYFDGKTTDDEILYRAEITRKQLREVLHHYEEFLQTFLHPS